MLYEWFDWNDVIDGMDRLADLEYIKITILGEKFANTF